MYRQDVLWTVESDYSGNPYYVTGNAILHALAHSGALNYDDQNNLSVSHGVFCPSTYGVFPEWHSQSSGRMNFPSTLKPIETYADLFLFRLPYHPWIHDGRPRDAVNTPQYRLYGDRESMATTQSIQTTGDKPRKLQWYIHAYLTAPKKSDLLPLDESALNNLQFGGNRNYGFGDVSVKDTQLTDLDTVDYSSIEDADSHLLELVTPFVLASELPKTNDTDIPNWWDKSLTYRTRQEQIVQQRDQYDLTVVDHGQVTKYYGPDATGTARNGIERVGTHSKYGYGEIFVRPTE